MAHVVEFGKIKSAKWKFGRFCKIKSRYTYIMNKLRGYLQVLTSVDMYID